jgi:hypothetical protein
MHHWDFALGSASPIKKSFLLCEKTYGLSNLHLNLSLCAAYILFSVYQS